MFEEQETQRFGNKTLMCLLRTAKDQGTVGGKNGVHRGAQDAEGSTRPPQSPAGHRGPLAAIYTGCRNISGSLFEHVKGPICRYIMDSNPPEQNKLIW